MKKVFCFLCMIFVSLFMVNSSLAQPVPLVPLKVGYTNAMFEIEWDSGNCINNSEECWWVKHEWQFYMIEGKTTIDGVEYFQEIQADLDMENVFEWNLDMPLARSTEDTLYWYTRSGNEYAAFTIDNVREGKGDFIPLQELDPEDDPGYLYIECDNYNVPEDNVILEWPEDSNEGWPDGNGEWPEGDFENTFDDVYYFKMYNCDYNSTSTCTSYQNDEYEVYWISKGTGIIKFLGGYNENGESPLGGVELRYLKFRKPARLRYPSIVKYEYEDGSIINRLNFEPRWFYYGLNPPGEMTSNFQFEDYATGVGNTIELFLNDYSIALNNYHFEFLRSGGWSLDGDNVSLSDEFSRLFNFSAEVDEPSEGTYNLVVKDGDGIVAAVAGQTEILPDGEFYYSPPVETLPVISANTFQTQNLDGDLIWSWTLDDFAYVPGGPYVRLYINAYQGESYIGYYSPNYKEENGNTIIIPVNDFPIGCNRLKLRAQVWLNDKSYRTLSNFISVPLIDSDGDGISNHVEDASVDSFTDGTTSGQITDRGDQVISVTDAASSTEGVLLSAYNGDQDATVSICGGAASVVLTDGDEIVVTCGSAIVKVLNGEVAADFFEDGVLVATAILTGETDVEENIIIFEPETGTFSVPGSNSTPVEAQFFNETGEPIASVELVGGGTNEDDNSIIFEQETGIFSVPDTNTASLDVVLDDGSEISLDPGDDFMSVDINIRPFSRRNTIILWNWGYIPVAILSNPDFYAPIDVEKASITFGQTGDEDSLVFCRNRARDVNGDGMKDLTCLFRTRDTGFEVGDTLGILKCDKTDLTKIQASDSVRIFGR